ncbi:MAG: histidine kinase dimerization/phospho-acceptor domain-containing protein, partial [Algiphilus sp.]
MPAVDHRRPLRPPTAGLLLALVLPWLTGTATAVLVWPLWQQWGWASERALLASGGMALAAALLVTLLVLHPLRRPWKELLAVAQAHRNGRFERLAAGPLPAHAQRVADALTDHAVARAHQQSATKHAVETATAGLRAQLEQLRRDARAAHERADDQQSALQHQSQLLAGLSHELRTPLSAIMGHADRLRVSAASADSQEQAESLYRCAQN